MSNTDTAQLGRGVPRPRTAAKRVLAVLAVALTSVVFVPMASAHGRACAKAHTRVASASRAQLQRTVVCLINDQRRMRGLPDLSENSRLNRSAQGWTDAMVSHRDFSHGADFAARITAAGFHWSNAGENIATGFATPTTVVTAWMASTGHCQNILNPSYRYVGTGVSGRPIGDVHVVGGTWTQDFGLLMGQPAASGNWGPADGCPYG
jgi:uncharacterized protein YkwD